MSDEVLPGTTSVIYAGNTVTLKDVPAGQKFRTLSEEKTKQAETVSTYTVTIRHIGPLAADDVATMLMRATTRSLVIEASEAVK